MGLRARGGIGVVGEENGRAVDIVSKRPLTTTENDSASTNKRVRRRCTRCGHSASASSSDNPPVQRTAGLPARADPLADYLALERAADAWADRLFKGNCVCGGWWMEE